MTTWIDGDKTGHGIPRGALNDYIKILKKKKSLVFRKIERGARRRRNWLMNTLGGGWKQYQ